MDLISGAPAELLRRKPAVDLPVVIVALPDEQFDFLNILNVFENVGQHRTQALLQRHADGNPERSAVFVHADDEDDGEIGIFVVRGQRRPLLRLFKGLGGAAALWRKRR